MRDGKGRSRKRGETRCDDIERRREDEQCQAGAQPAAREADRAGKRKEQAQPDQPGRANRGFHQPLGRYLLDRRQQVAAGPVGPRAARRGDQIRWKSASCSARSTSSGAPPSLTRHAQRAFLDRLAQQGRLQVPVAEHRRGRAEVAHVDERDAGPARLARRSARTRRAPRRPEPSRPRARVPRPARRRVRPAAQLHRRSAGSSSPPRSG